MVGQHDRPAMSSDSITWKSLLRCVTSGLILVLAAATSFGQPAGAQVPAASHVVEPRATTTWTSDAVPSGLSSLNGIACPTATSCYAVGTSTSGAGAIVATTASGGTWALHSLGPGADLYGIACPTATSCYAVGTSTSGDGVVIATTDSWTTWTAQPVPSSVTKIYGMACPATADCYAVGSGSNGGVVLATTDSGTTWTSETVPSGGSAPPSFAGLACASTTTCWAVGPYPIGSPVSVAVIATTNGGKTWVFQSPPAATGSLASIACASSADCLAVGFGGNAAYAAATTNGGTTWASQSLPSGVIFLSGVACTSPTTCWSAGFAGSFAQPSGSIVATTDGGTTWTSETLPSGTRQLSAVSCTTAGACYAVGSLSAGGATILTNEVAAPPAPTVTSISPTSGPATGETQVTITGTNFTSSATVSFGTYAATGVSCASTTSCVATSPAGSGTVDVTVTTAAGTSATSSGDKFTYASSSGTSPTVTSIAPTSGPATGGTQVTITGTNVTSPATVAFGSAQAAGVTVDSATQITATSPAGSGVVDVTVATAAGTSATSSGDKFTYTSSSSPTVTSISPAFGPPAGGTQVTITGTNFTSGATVAFGTNAATGVSCASTTSCVATSPHGTGTVDVTVTTPSGTSVTSSGDKFTYTSSSSGPTGYFAVSPARICDTRTGQPQNQCSGAPLGAGVTKVVTVAGNGGVPASGASAVVLNVTAANPTQTSYLTVFPDGETKPLASSLNFHAGTDVPNLVTVALPQDGKVDVYNAAGSADLIVDVEGYYAAEPTAGTGLYNALTPVRICDTRTGEPQNQCTGHAPGPSQAMQVTVVGQGGVPSSGVAAVVLNVTAIGSAASGYLTVYPYGISQPSASNVNYRAGEVVPNRVMVPLGKGGMIAIYSGNGDPNVAVDVSGWFTDSSNTSATGALFTAAPTPVRICDTRTGQPQNQCTGKTLTAQGILDVQTTGHGGVPTAATAVVANVTVANETSNGYLTIFPGPGRPPNASDLNFTAGDAVANMAVATLGSNGQFDAYNSLGRTDVIVDLVGWYS